MRLLSKFSSIARIKAATVLFVFALASSICFLQNNVAEARANINWKTTSVSIEPGKATINGYFYNDGDAGAEITKFEISGYIEQYDINATFSGSTLTVGSLGANKKINWTFVIKNNTFYDYNSNPIYDFDSRVTFR